MAQTQILHANQLTQKAWSGTVFEIMLDDMQLSKLMGEGNGMPIITDGELRDRPGDQIIFELDMPLTNEGGTDDSDIEGNEEAMSFFNFPVIIHERSNAVRTKGLMTDKRSAVKIMSKATFALARWAGEQLENDLIWSLSGIGNQNTIIGERKSSICEPYFLRRTDYS
jgi:N4-gp56 family major capsid protein